MPHSTKELNYLLKGNMRGLCDALGVIPNKSLSTHSTIRSGTNGSLKIEVGGPRAGKWHNFEDKEGGSPLALIKYLGGMDWRAAEEWACDYLGITDNTPVPIIDYAAIEKAADDKAREYSKKAEWAKELYAQSVPIEGTPAEAYLRSRSITAWPDCVRYKGPSQRRPGGLIVPALNAEGDIQAVQIIHLTAEGKKVGKDAKRSHGRVTGAAVRLPGKHPIILAEGPETALSVWLATGRETWALLGVSNFVNAPVPEGVDITIAGDDYSQDTPAEASTNQAVSRFLKAGHRVSITNLEPGTGDFNDIHQAYGLDAVRDIIDAAHQQDIKKHQTLSDRLDGDPWKIRPARRRQTMRQQKEFLAGSKTERQAFARSLAVAIRMVKWIPFKIEMKNLIAEIVGSVPRELLSDDWLDIVVKRVEFVIQTRKKEAAAEVNLPPSVWHQHNVVTVPEFRPIPADQMFGVFIIKGGWGSGKTQIMGRSVADWAKAANKRMAAICHRISLVLEMAERLDIACYYDDPGYALGVNRLAICLPSISLSKFDSFLDGTSVLFIDEISQVLRFFSAQQQCSTREGDARAVFERFVNLVRNAEVIVVADAVIDERTIKFLEYCRPGEVFNIINREQPPADADAEIFSGVTAGASIDAVISAELHANGAVWLAVESVKTGRYFEKRFTDAGFKCLFIHAGNKGGSNQSQFLENIEDKSKNYDLVIASPVISSGVSIQHEGEPRFTLTAFIGGGQAITAQDAAQMMKRIRYVKRFAIGILPNNIYGGQDAKTLHQVAVGLFGAEPDEGRGTFDSLIAHIKAGEINARADFGARLFWQLEAAGWNLTRSADGADSRYLKTAKNKADAELIEALIKSDDISDEEYEKLENKRIRTDDESTTLFAAQMRRDLNITDITEVDIDFYLDAGMSRLRRFEALVDGVGAQGDNSKVRSVFAAPRQGLRVRFYKYLFDGFDISQPRWLTPDVAEIILDRIIARRHELAFLNMVSGKFSVQRNKKNGTPLPFARPVYPVREVVDILGRCGVDMIDERPMVSDGKISKSKVPLAVHIVPFQYNLNAACGHGGELSPENDPDKDADDGVDASRIRVYSTDVKSVEVMVARSSHLRLPERAPFTFTPTIKPGRIGAVDEMLAIGVVALCPAGMAAVLPWRFKTPKAAKRYLEHNPDEAARLKGSPFGQLPRRFGTQRIRYEVPGNRKKRAAIIYPDTIQPTDTPIPGAERLFYDKLVLIGPDDFA